MIDPQTFLKVLAFSVLLVTLLVAGRLLWCLIIAVRARRYPILFVSLAGLICIVATLSMVVIVWFAYAVAHTGKDANTDRIVLLITVPPFFLVSFGLWLLGGNLHSRLRTGVAQPGTQENPP